MSVVIREWIDQAACLGADSDLFFPEQAVIAHIVRRKERQAKAICETCPVTRECLDDALRMRRTHDVGGIRGGLTKDERDAYRKVHRVKADPTFRTVRVRGRSLPSA